MIPPPSESLPGSSHLDLRFFQLYPQAKKKMPMMAATTLAATRVMQQNSAPIDEVGEPDDESGATEDDWERYTLFGVLNPSLVVPCVISVASVQPRCRCSSALKLAAPPVHRAYCADMRREPCNLGVYLWQTGMMARKRAGC